MLWIILAVMTLVALGFVVLPLLRQGGRPGRRRADYDMAVYRDQLDELETDRARGLLDDASYGAARLEVERRLLESAHDEAPPPDEAPAPHALAPATRRLLALALGVGLPVFAFALYGQIGAPELARKPAATSAPPIAALTAQLAKKMQSRPNDLKGWRLLGRSYMALRAYDQAAAAFEHAAGLAPMDADLQLALGEALLSANKGQLNDLAVRAFKQAHMLDDRQPGARFYLALADYQAGRLQQAYDGWLALARASDPDAPWMPQLRAHLNEAASKLGIDAPQLPTAGAPTAPARGPTASDIAAARNMSAGEQAAMIKTMVARLAGKLRSNPEDPAGWMRLGRAYVVLGERAKAIDAYKQAARRWPASSAEQAQAKAEITRLKTLPDQ